MNKKPSKIFNISIDVEIIPGMTQSKLANVLSTHPNILGHLLLHHLLQSLQLLHLLLVLLHPVLTRMETDDSLLWRQKIREGKNLWKHIVQFLFNLN